MHPLASLSPRASNKPFVLVQQLHGAATPGTQRVPGYGVERRPPPSSEFTALSCQNHCSVVHLYYRVGKPNGEVRMASASPDLRVRSSPPRKNERFVNIPVVARRERSPRPAILGPRGHPAVCRW